MHRLFQAGLIVLTLASHSTLASAKKPKTVWQVAQTRDPITGASNCIVAAYDRAAGLSFSRTGALYPFVEQSSVHGLLIGVSSGGRFRVPTGDIIWRVDDRPYRTLTAADNPTDRASALTTGTSEAMTQLIGQQMKLVAAATATSTVASGAAAQEMLAELVAGRALIFRSANATASFGLPTGAEQRVGQVTRNGLRPYPIDESFKAGLVACGITSPPEAKVDR